MLRLLHKNRLCENMFVPALLATLLPHHVVHEVLHVVLGEGRGHHRLLRLGLPHPREGGGKEGRRGKGRTV